MITQELVHTLFKYKEDTGYLIRKISTSSRARKGDRAGTCTMFGYRQVRIESKWYKETQVIWLYLYNKLQKNIDHINGIRDDNRLVNLRESTISQNSCNTKTAHNSKTQIKGVSESYIGNRFIGYRCYIAKEGHATRRKRFGVPEYGTKEKALQLATEWIRVNREELHDAYANHG
jgi:hypothetical protein